LRFLVDESTGPAVARWLRQQQHDVFSVYEQARGPDDAAVLQRAVSEDRILITNDKDFGELIFRDRRAQRGAVLLRLQDERAANKIETIRRLLEHYAEQLSGNFVVTTGTSVRIVRLRRGSERDG